MGTYLNPGRQSFEEAVGSEIYVDKTGMLAYLNTLVNTKQKYVSVSRPRRFGKTMAADMVCAGVRVSTCARRWERPTPRLAASSWSLSTSGTWCSGRDGTGG